jgi:hypothetical protein
MFDRLRKALLGDPNHEVLGGRDSDDTDIAGASLGGKGAVADHHRGQAAADDSGSAGPAYGDDEFTPQIPPDPS